MWCFLVYSSGNDQRKVSKHLGEAQEVTFPLRAAEEGRQREYNLYTIIMLWSRQDLPASFQRLCIRNTCTLRCSLQTHLWALCPVDRCLHIYVNSCVDKVFPIYFHIFLKAFMESINKVIEWKWGSFWMVGFAARVTNSGDEIVQLLIRAMASCLSFHKVQHLCGHEWVPGYQGMFSI